MCLRQVSRQTALEKSAWFHLGNNSCMSILYSLRRINEMCKEHVENNFLPLPEEYMEEYEVTMTRVSDLMLSVLDMMNDDSVENVSALRRSCDDAKDAISDIYHRLYARLHDGDPADMTVLYVYLNMLQETREMVSSLRRYLRAYAKLRDNSYTGKS